MNKLVPSFALLVFMVTGCAENVPSSDNDTPTTDVAVSDNLRGILFDLYCTVSESGHFPGRFSGITRYDAEYREQFNKPALDLNSNYFVCPGTGTHPGNMADVDEWTDFIYVGNVEDTAPEVPLLISPPENHRGKYGYVATSGRGILRLPSNEVRALIIEPWLLSTNETADNIDSIKRSIKVNVPPRLQRLYTNVNNWTRPPLKW